MPIYNGLVLIRFPNYSLSSSLVLTRVAESKNMVVYLVLGDPTIPSRKDLVLVCTVEERDYSVSKHSSVNGVREESIP